MTAKKHICPETIKICCSLRSLCNENNFPLLGLASSCKATLLFWKSWNTADDHPFILLCIINEACCSAIADTYTCSQPLHMVQEWTREKLHMQHIAPTESSSVGVAHKHCASCHKAVLMWTLKAQQQPICWNTQVKCSYLEEVQSVCLQHFHLHPSIILLQQLCVLRAILPASEMAGREEKKFYTWRRWIYSQESYLRRHIFKEPQLLKKNWEHSNTENKQKGLKCITKECNEKRFHASSTKAQSKAGWLLAAMCSCLKFLCKKAMFKTNNFFFFKLIL